MNDLMTEFKNDTGYDPLDHNGNYDYRYVAWLEDKVDHLMDDLREQLN